MVRFFLCALLMLCARPSTACDTIPSEVNEMFSQCQMTYYKYAPSCRGGSGACLSLVLYGLVNQNLFDYREDLRRQYRTPLQRKMFQKTPAYERAVKEMEQDLESLEGAVLCAQMKPRWIYNLERKAFVFSAHPISNTETSLFTQGGKEVKLDSTEALKVEEWDEKAGSKFVFFKVARQRGRLEVRYSDFVWLKGEAEFTYEGDFEVSYKESCSALDGSGVVAYRLRR